MSDMVGKNCPICNAVCSRTYDSDEGRLCEDEEICPNGHYESSYAYGSHREIVGEQTWEWTYQTENPPYDEIKQAIQKLRKEWPVEEQRRSFIRTICENPQDDTPRLVFADWLDERGDEESRCRAEFIRVQIKLSKMGSTRCLKTFEETSWYKYTKRCRCTICRLRQREYYSSRDYVVWDWSVRLPTKIVAGSFRRGFTNKIVTSLGEWLQDGPEIVRNHPIERVFVTDKTPALIETDTHPVFQFFESTMNSATCLPYLLFAHNPKLHSDFASVESAMNELSVACIALAHHQSIPSGVSS